MTHYGLALGAMAALAMSCSSQPLRAVIDVVPDSVSYELHVRAAELRPGSAVDEVELGREFDPGMLDDPDMSPFSHGTSEAMGWEHAAPWALALATVPGEIEQSEPQDPNQGPTDLGLPVLIDFGAGEAPYDDGIPTIHGLELTRSGFSDSLLQVSMRRPFTATSVFHGTVAVSRYQDIGIMDGLSDMRFAWFVVGLKTAH